MTLSGGIWTEVNPKLQVFSTFNCLPAGVSLDVLCCVLEQETLLCPKIQRGVGGGIMVLMRVLLELASMQLCFLEISSDPVDGF